MTMAAGSSPKPPSAPSKAAQALRLRSIGLTNKQVAAVLGVPLPSARRLISEGKRGTGEAVSHDAPNVESGVQLLGSVPVFTRRCRNRHCIERFVPVNDQHWYHEPACRESADLWSPEDILREEGSLSAGSHPLEMVKRAFGQKNQLLRKVTALTSQREYLAYEVSNFYRDNPEYRWPPLPSVPHDDGKRGERALVVQLSDWQIGKLENGIGIDEMRKRIARIRAAIRSVVERQRAAGYAVNHVTLSWGGDMIEGCYIYGGQNVTGLDRSSNTHRITTQIRVVAHMKAEVAFDVASYVENVDNEVVGGNHARPNGKNDFADPEDNFDLLAAHWASDITQNEPRIRWNVHEDWWGAFDSLGHRFVSFHGDQWRGPFTKLEDLLPKWTANDVFGQKPEVVLTHHRHDFATLRVGGMFVCQGGTIDGGSKWYLKAYGKSSPPTQVIHVVSERRATESLWPVDFV